jgi:hypothetical protein
MQSRAEEIIEHEINGLIGAVRHNRGGPAPTHTQLPGNGNTANSSHESCESSGPEPANPPQNDPAHRRMSSVLHLVQCGDLARPSTRSDRCYDRFSGLARRAIICTHIKARFGGLDLGQNQWPPAAGAWRPDIVNEREIQGIYHVGINQRFCGIKRVNSRELGSQLGHC